MTRRVGEGSKIDGAVRRGGAHSSGVETNRERIERWEDPRGEETVMTRRSRASLDKGPRRRTRARSAGSGGTDEDKHNSELSREAVPSHIFHLWKGVLSAGYDGVETKVKAVRSPVCIHQVQPRNLVILERATSRALARVRRLRCPGPSKFRRKLGDRR